MNQQPNKSDARPDARSILKKMMNNEENDNNPSGSFCLSDLIFKNPDNICFDTFNLIISTFIKFFGRDNFPPQFFKRYYGHVYLIDIARVCVQVIDYWENQEERERQMNETSTSDMTESWTEFTTRNTFTPDSRNDSFGSNSTYYTKFEMSQVEDTQMYGKEAWRTMDVMQVWGSMLEIICKIRSIEKLGNNYFSIVVGQVKTNAVHVIVEVVATNDPTKKLINTSSGRSLRTALAELTKIIDYIFTTKSIIKRYQNDLEEKNISFKVLLEKNLVQEKIKLLSDHKAKRPARKTKNMTNNDLPQKVQFQIFKNVFCNIYT